MQGALGSVHGAGARAAVLTRNGNYNASLEGTKRNR